MKYITLSTINKEDHNNNFFHKDRSWIYKFTRDDKNTGFIHLKKKFLDNNITINTSDIKTIKKPILDIQYADATEIINENTFFLLPEHYLISPKNKLSTIENKYKKIFIQFDEAVDNKKKIKLNTPFVIKPKYDKNFFSRKFFATMIASNKGCKLYSKKIMYPQRYKTIKWFEKNYPNMFFLYGTDWNLPMKKSGFLGRVYNFLIKLFKINNRLSCYKGKAKNKFDILKKTKFNFCYENISENGYISDIIFDSFNNGCVPVYMGPNNIKKYIPSKCFINRNNFKNHEDLLTYLKNFTQKDYNEMYLNIIKNDKKKKFNKFKKKFIVQKILSEVKKIKD